MLYFLFNKIPDELNFAAFLSFIYLLRGQIVTSKEGRDPNQRVYCNPEKASIPLV
jgi:hypothetical protein